jgi:hypothetical protein
MWAVIGLVGTGSVIDAGVFSVFSTLSSYTVYVANDYFWDHSFRPPLPQSRRHSTHRPARGVTPGNT